MAWPLGVRAKKAWDAFWNNKDPTIETSPESMSNSAYTTSYRPDRLAFVNGNERTIIASVFNRISNDVSSNNIRHVKLDEQDRFKSVVKDALNNCLSTEANIDQTGRALIHDTCLSMLDEGVIAIVPVTTDVDPNTTESYEILELRVGKIIEWRPYSVRVEIYNENAGRHDQIWVQKRHTAIVENPFYSVMNESNSTLRRLNHKLMLLDKIDAEVGSNKFDLIIQLPYLTKQQAKKQQADERRREIEEQLNGSKLGVAYIDAAERVIQLNRPLENTLLGQIEYLTKQMFSQLGLTQEILDGTANESTMNNYNKRVIETILLALTEEMERKFLSKTARTQRHAIRFFSDPLRLVPTSQIPEFADKLTRNEIVTSNEIRQSLGLIPSTDPEADELRNKNLNKVEPSSGSANQSNDKARQFVERILKQTKPEPNQNQNGEESK